MHERRFTLQDQLAFAALTGDFNPLHIDAVAARRSMFGGPVVHGVHTLLWALDAWAREHDRPIALRSIKVTFNRPTILDERVRWVTVIEKAAHVALEVRNGTVLSTTILVEFDPSVAASASAGDQQSCIDAIPERREPSQLSASDLNGLTGSLELYSSRSETGRLFPHLSKHLPVFQLATILNTTRLVGVDCPGLHSIFSTLELSFRNVRQQHPVVRYAVSKFDRRVGLVKLGLEAESVSGTIRAFVRPAPIKQPSYSMLGAFIQEGEFSEQKALIIGGSRGMGEVAAKLLAAGGAAVWITYHQGEQDARRVVADITTHGGRAGVTRFNVLDAPATPDARSVAQFTPTHCYYFATPFIFSGVGGVFSTNLFSKFCAYYVAGLANVVSYWGGWGVKRFFSPSTTAIDELPLNMGEYAVAKAAAEKLCEFLEKSDPELKIYRPRLPRLATDQTVTVVPVRNEDTVRITLDHLHAFQALRPQP